MCIICIDIERDKLTFLEAQRNVGEMWEGIDNFGVVSPVVGFDFYHFKNKFWLIR